MCEEYNHKSKQRTHTHIRKIKIIEFGFGNLWKLTLVVGNLQLCTHLLEHKIGNRRSHIREKNQKEKLVVGNLPTMYTLVENTKLEANLTCLKPPTLLENTTCCIKWKTSWAKNSFDPWFRWKLSFTLPFCHCKSLVIYFHVHALFGLN